ncbi:MAG: SagB/ThcOx family dehydrogenase [bacterium]|nr:SagB/ThcOx family dehydrogenase [bacterium]
MHFLFEFFNRNRPPISQDHSEWPDEWKRVDFKTYPRLKQVALPPPELENVPLKEAILKRKSSRDFSDEPLTLQEISTLLFFGGGLTELAENMEYSSRRTYPSGGARYPIEIYFVARNIKDLTPGFYHYNVRAHSLELLGETDKEDESKFFHYDFADSAPGVFVFAIIPERSTRKYGNFGLKLGLIEAGHISENIYLISPVLGIKCCALGGLDEDKAVEAFDLDLEEEIPFYALAVGK